MNIRSMLFGIALVCGAIAQGATILDVNGPNPFGFGGQRAAYVLGWHQTTSFSNVSITMPLEDQSVGGPLAGTEAIAYLMNQIGPGTSPVNEVATPLFISGL